MPKTIFTPRSEPVCGKLDAARALAVALGSVEPTEPLDDIQFDCERMERKLVSRKQEAEPVARLSRTEES